MQSPPWLHPVTLPGTYVVLEPLSHLHSEDLIEATRDGELWKLWYTSVPSPDEMTDEIDRRLDLQAAGTMLPFAVIDPSSDKAVGMTTYMNVDSVHRRVEIGSTWYRRSSQRTALNTEAKLLLLTHAFEKLDCIAVEFRTHVLNQPSRRAIERLGAKLDGILRNHRRTPDGLLRDTCVYSIIDTEWALIQRHLQFELQRPR